MKGDVPDEELTAVFLANSAQGRRSTPIVLMIGDIATKKLFQGLIGPFCGPIGLRVVGYKNPRKQHGSQHMSEDGSQQGGKTMTKVKYYLTTPSLPLVPPLPYLPLV